MATNIRDLIHETVTKMGIAAEVEERTLPDLAVPYLNIVTHDASFLISTRAETLSALEFLLKRIVEKAAPEERPAFFLDINGYRAHRLEELKTEAKHLARRVRLYRTELALKPMTPFERRIVHIALAEYPDITTQSVGEGQSRRVTIKPYP